MIENLHRHPELVFFYSVIPILMYTNIYIPSISGLILTTLHTFQ